MATSVEKALQAITLLAEQPMSASELARRLETHRSTISRLVRTLEDHRFVRRDPDGTLRLGSFLTTLPAGDLRKQELIELARPYIDDLGDRYGHTVHFAGLEGADVVYWDKVESRQVLRMYSTIGAIAPAHATGVGKAVLAHLPAERRDQMLGVGELHAFTEHTLTDRKALDARLTQIARDGWALDEAEHEDFIHCVAAPVLGPDGIAVAAVSITAPQMLVSRDDLLGMVPDLLEVATRISHEIGETAP